MHFCFIWPIDRTLSGVTNSAQSGPGSNSNEGVFRILQSCSITEASTSDYLASYTEHSLRNLTPLHRWASNAFYVTKYQFLNGVKLVLMMSFLSALLSGEMVDGLMPFPIGICSKWNANNLLKHLNSSHFLWR